MWLALAVALPLLVGRCPGSVPAGHPSLVATLVSQDPSGSWTEGSLADLARVGPLDPGDVVRARIDGRLEAAPLQFLGAEGLTPQQKCEAGRQAWRAAWRDVGGKAWYLTYECDPSPEWGMLLAARREATPANTLIAEYAAAEFTRWLAEAQKQQGTRGLVPIRSGLAVQGFPAIPVDAPPITADLILGPMRPASEWPGEWLPPLATAFRSDGPGGAVTAPQDAAPLDVLSRLSPDGEEIYLAPYLNTIVTIGVPRVGFHHVVVPLFVPSGNGLRRELKLRAYAQVPPPDEANLAYSGPHGTLPCRAVVEALADSLRLGCVLPATAAQLDDVRVCIAPGATTVGDVLDALAGALDLAGWRVADEVLIGLSPRFMPECAPPDNPQAMEVGWLQRLNATAALLATLTPEQRDYMHGHHMRLPTTELTEEQVGLIRSGFATPGNKINGTSYADLTEAPRSEVKLDFQLAVHVDTLTRGYVGERLIARTYCKEWELDEIEE
jgi:hypothetical protein